MDGQVKLPAAGREHFEHVATDVRDGNLLPVALNRPPHGAEHLHRHGGRDAVDVRRHVHDDAVRGRVSECPEHLAMVRVDARLPCRDAGPPRGPHQRLKVLHAVPPRGREDVVERPAVPGEVEAPPHLLLDRAPQLPLEVEAVRPGDSLPRQHH